MHGVTGSNPVPPRSLTEGRSSGPAFFVGTQVIDMEALRARCGGDEELLRELLRDFLERCESDARQLEEGGEELYRHAHKLKGMALNLSMPRLQERSATLESSARKGMADPDEVEQVLRELESACREARRILENEHSDE